MNKFDEYISQGKTKAGSQKHLAEIIGIRENSLSDMVAGRRPIPAAALARLAQFLGNVTPGQIWEAQQAARAETEEEKQLWLPFIRAAAVLSFFCVGAAICVTYTPEAQAQTQNAVKTVFIMSTWKKIKGTLRKVAAQAKKTLLFFWPCQPTTI